MLPFPGLGDFFYDYFIVVIDERYFNGIFQTFWVAVVGQLHFDQTDFVLVRPDVVGHMLDGITVEKDNPSKDKVWGQLHSLALFQLYYGRFTI